MEQKESVQNPTKSFFLKKSVSEPDIGFTTGTCAAAGSVAAARMVLTQKIVPYVILTTPKGIKVCIEIEDQVISKDVASCSVRKYSGKDSDVTNGTKICSKVTKECDDAQRITISGGMGIGRVTLPGLDQKPGEWAINSVPRKMICDGINRERERIEETCSLSVEISAPEGAFLATKTFNPKLGIIGGISILGTSGIVEPMSEQAILDTIKIEINIRKSQGKRVLLMTPGNYGSEFLQSEFGFSLEAAVHCSNFIYDAVLMAQKAGFKQLLLCGHMGKLVKVAAGIKNTHSKYGDHRMGTLCSVAKKFVAENEFPLLQEKLMACISTEQAIHELDLYGEHAETRLKICTEITRMIQKVLTDWTGGAMQCEVIVFTKENGLLGETPEAKKYITQSKEL